MGRCEGYVRLHDDWSGRGDCEWTGSAHLHDGIDDVRIEIVSKLPFIVGADFFTHVWKLVELQLENTEDVWSSDCNVSSEANAYARMHAHRIQDEDMG